MMTAATDAIRRTRRWYQFRLRTMLVATAVVAALLTIALQPFQEWRRHERARAQRDQLLNLGDYPGDIPLRRGEPPIQR